MIYVVLGVLGFAVICIMGYVLDSIGDGVNKTDVKNNDDESVRRDETPSNSRDSSITDCVRGFDIPITNMGYISSRRKPSTLISEPINNRVFRFLQTPVSLGELINSGVINDINQVVYCLSTKRYTPTARNNFTDSLDIAPEIYGVHQLNNLNIAVIAYSIDVEHLELDVVYDQSLGSIRKLSAKQLLTVESAKELYQC